MVDFYQTPWLVFMLGRERYALPTGNVRTMIEMPEIVPVPLAPTYVRGVITLRGQTTPIIDLRLKLGMESLLSLNHDLMEMIKEREQDHRNWLNELRKSVEEKRHFTLATDPHQCKFGKWYDLYKPISLLEKELFDKIDDPHKAIHELAKKCETLINSGQSAQALNLIKQAEGKELASVIKLFQDYVSLFKKQLEFEIAIVIEVNNLRAAIAVDTIVTVEKLSPESVEPMPDVALEGNKSEAEFIAKSGKDKNLVYLLSAEKIVAEAHS